MRKIFLIVFLACLFLYNGYGKDARCQIYTGKITYEKIDEEDEQVLKTTDDKIILIPADIVYGYERGCVYDAPGAEITLEGTLERHYGKIYKFNNNVFRCVRNPANKVVTLSGIISARDLNGDLCYYLNTSKEQKIFLGYDSEVSRYAAKGCVGSGLAVTITGELTRGENGVPRFYQDNYICGDKDEFLKYPYPRSSVMSPKIFDIRVGQNIKNIRDVLDYFERDLGYARDEKRKDGNLIVTYSDKSGALCIRIDCDARTGIIKAFYLTPKRFDLKSFFAGDFIREFTRDYDIPKLTPLKTNPELLRHEDFNQKKKRGYKILVGPQILAVRLITNISGGSAR